MNSKNIKYLCSGLDFESDDIFGNSVIVNVLF